MQFQGQRNDEQNNAHLYKTTLCKNFVEHGHCKYENNCRFAHGESELRQSSNMGGGKPNQSRPYDRNNNFNNSRGGAKPYNNDRGGYKGGQGHMMSNNFNAMPHNMQQQMPYGNPQTFTNQPDAGVGNHYGMNKANPEEVDDFGMGGQNKHEFSKGPGMNQGRPNNYNNNNQKFNYAYNPSNNNKFGQREQKPYGGGFQNQYNKNPMGGDRNYNSGGGFRQQGGQDNQNSLFKTSLCKFFQQGSCKFGNNCKFAHGDTELSGSSPRQNMGNNFDGNAMKGLENPDQFPMMGEHKEQIEQQQQQQEGNDEFPMIGGDYNANNMQNSN